MDARNTPANKPLDGIKFLEMLSTISLEEVLKYEFRRTQAKKWDLLVEVCKDASTKKYQCNVCNVVQFGDKNLFSHLTGKKHNALLTSIMDLQIRKRGPPPQRGRPGEKPAGNSNSNNNNASNSNNSNNLNSRNSNSNNNANSNSKPNNSNSNKPNISNSNSNNSNQNKPVQRNVSPQKKPTPNSGANKKPEEPKPSTAEKPSGNGPPSRGAPNTNSSAKSQPQRKPGQNDKPAPRDNSAKNKNNVPNIVKNPLSQKISIVPLAKLISSNPEPEEDDSDMPMDVIVIDEDPPSENANQSIPIQTGLRQPAQEVDKNSQKRSAPPSSRPAVKPSVSENSTARPDGLTFESSNVTEILGLVGVEYVLKIVRSVNARNARYLCCLCDITADEQRMQNHLVGYNHRLKYFDKHFPTAMRQYRQYVANVPESDVAKIMMPIFEKLAMAIEKHHGRESPYMCYEYYFGKDRNSLTTKVFSRRHASELLGPSFTHVVDAKEVEQMIEKMRQSKQQPQPLMGMEPSNPYGQPYAQQARPNNYANYNPEGPANNPPQSQTVDDETHKRMVDRFLRGNRPSRGDSHGSRNPKRNRSRSPSNEQRKRTVTNPTKRLWNVERRSLSPLRDGDIWQAYRHMVDQKVRDLNVSFDAYKADPEQHPNYQQEWQRFWKRRKDELIQAGINHRSYNFQNEWIHYFNARLDELYNLEIEDIKLKCRERLCLPLTNHELENEKYHVHVRGVEEPQLRQPEPRQPEPRQQAPHQLAPRQLEPRQLEPRQIEPRQLAPRQLEPRQPEQGHPDPSKKIRNSPPKEVEPPNVIHVLRLLTALENYLGSLGPFVTEMLAKALQTQRLYPDRVHNVILTSENCAILETAKEKFTGLLISQIYDPTKEKALKRAVHDTEMLLEEATKFVAPKDPDSIKIAPQVMEKPQGFGFDNKNKNPNQMQLLDQNSKKPFDKTELAAKLASSLVSQGKTSINREELQKILQVYNLIEQKKRQDDPPNSSDSPDRPIRSRNSPFDSEANDNPLSQHSTRNLNTNNETSNFTGQNYSENVARLNNKNSNMANSDNNYTSDRGFGSGSRQNSGSGGYQNTQYPSGSGTLQSSQYGSGLGSLQGNQYGARSGGLRNSEYGSGSGPAGLQQNLFGSGGGGLSSNQFGLGSGGLNNNPYGSGSSGGRYSSTQPGTGGSSLSSSSVLPNNLQMSSLFNFNTNLNPTYNSNRRSHNY